MELKDIKAGVYIHLSGLKKITVFPNPEDPKELLCFSKNGDSKIIEPLAGPEAFILFWVSLEEWQKKQKYKFRESGRILHNKKLGRLVCTTGEIIKDNEDENREKFKAITLQEANSSTIWFYIDFENWQDVTATILD